MHVRLRRVFVVKLEDVGTASSQPSCSFFADSTTECENREQEMVQKDT